MPVSVSSTTPRSQEVLKRFAERLSKSKTLHDISEGLKSLPPDDVRPPRPELQDRSPGAGITIGGGMRLETAASEEAKSIHERNMVAFGTLGKLMMAGAAGGSMVPGVGTMGGIALGFFIGLAVIATGADKS